MCKSHRLQLDKNWIEDCRVQAFEAYIAGKNRYVPRVGPRDDQAGPNGTLKAGYLNEGNEPQGRPC